MQSPDGQDLFAAAPLPVAPLDDAQRVACLRLIRSENVGPATFRALINHYGGAAQALAALPEIGARAGHRKPLRIYAAEAAEAEIEAAQRAGIQLLFTIEPGYPAVLAFTDGAPPLIYVKGRTELLNRPTVAVVGSRQASAAGIELARVLAGGLGAGKMVVASGLARGIDGAAHQAALETGTVAVLAGGLDVNYPPEHRALQAQIGERGCLVSEMPMAFQPRAQDFPRRNRIISGISRGVVVIEAARRSGTLITARLANEQGREVFAVPGNPLDPRAEGTNQLIKDGATLVTSADDVLAALAQQLAPPAFEALGAGPLRSEPDGSERAISLATRSSVQPAERLQPPAADAIGLVERALGPAPVTFDALARATGLPVRDVRVAVMELAIVGAVEFHGAQLISLRQGR